jgi:lysophospholipase L1-like esterase
MEKIETRRVHRFAFPNYGWVALLMLASALVGVAAGHAYGEVPPAAAAPAQAVLTHVEPAASTSIDQSALDRNELMQEKKDMRLAQKESKLAPNVVINLATANDLRQEMYDMRQARKAVQPAAEVAPVDVNAATESSIVEQYHMRILIQKQAEVAPVNVNAASASTALERYRILKLKQLEGY